MRYSAYDKEFISLINNWIEDSGEVYIVVRHAYSGGSKDYLFVYSILEFKALLNILPSIADVIVFKQLQLPIRGFMDDLLLKKVKEIYPQNIELDILPLPTRVSKDTHLNHLHLLELLDALSINLESFAVNLKEKKELLNKFWVKYHLIGDKKYRHYWENYIDYTQWEIDEDQLYLSFKKLISYFSIDSSRGGGTTWKEVEEDLERFWGLNVAIGEEAAWWVADNENMISGLIPMPDGNIRSGPY